MRGWSVGARRSPDWTTVVGTPKRAYTWAISQPVGPPPRTSRLFGSSRASVASRFVHGSIASRPGIVGTFEKLPTATMTFAGVELVDLVVVADLDAAATDDLGGPAVARRAGVLEAPDVAPVVRLLGAGRRG